MNLRNIRIKSVLGLLIFLGCLAAVQAQEVKIKVVVENASIRVKPGIDGAVLEDKIPVGAVYLSSQKASEWYQVSFRSRSGLQLTGYIHEMYVEVAKEEPGPAGQKPSVFSGLEPARVREMKTLEIGLVFGLSSGSLFNGSTSYEYSWNYVNLASVNETGEITHMLRYSPAFSLSLAYYFRESLGIRLSADYVFKQSLSDAKSAYKVSWSWTPESGGLAGTAENNWSVKGRYSLVPVSAAFIYKVPTAGAFAPYFVLGITVFVGKANIETTLGYADSWRVDDGQSITQYVDYFAIPSKLEKTLITAGGNIGAGIDVLLSPYMALTIDTVCYLGPVSNAGWSAEAGSYRGILHPEYTATYDQSTMTNFQGELTNLNLKLFFFRLAAGLKILF